MPPHPAAPAAECGREKSKDGFFGESGKKKPGRDWPGKHKMKGLRKTLQQENQTAATAPCTGQARAATTGAKLTTADSEIDGNWLAALRMMVVLIRSPERVSGLPLKTFRIVTQFLENVTIFRSLPVFPIFNGETPEFLHRGKL
ncbi:MAG: hypothetical protein OXF43_05595 [Gammaproteobacteria bacterium]|nr:hypothetical protein [Gammaproteobacteria bacterium]